MKFSVEDHRLFKNGNPVSWKKSPNHGGVMKSIDLGVVHYTGDNGTGGLQWLTQAGSGVSAHLWIAKTGVVWQLLAFNVVGWHAGRSEWDGRSNCNAFSVGIELQGTGDHFPDAQIEALIGVLVALHQAYPLQGIAGHDEVALPPGRKPDPGPRFPWDRVFQGLKEAKINYD